MSSSSAGHTKLEAISSLEDSQNELAKSEKSWIRRPVAMICLAVSMGASGILLSQNKPAIATNSVTANANVAITNLPNFSDLHREESKLSPLALKYKVQEGDTIARLAYKYQVKPEAIATINNLGITAKLESGKTIKIPSDKDSSQKIIPKSSLETVNEHKSVGTKTVNTSFDHLKQTRTRLQHSLAELKTEQVNNVRKEKIVADVSQPLKRTEEKETLTTNLETVGVTPSNPSMYKNPFEIPIGTTVGPKLPGISNPDDYLPDAPMRFTGHIWPTKGVITSGYGPRWGRMHRGIDIAAPVGTPIVSSAPGEVITVGWDSGGYGKYLKVRHPDGSVTLYGHNSRHLVRRGQKVEQGQKIAEMGNTGRSTGPHLHYEIRPLGKGPQDPMAFLPKNR
ncbi:MAG: M23 family metallopeptidase [Flavobacteriaceae bacterium]|nr:M23 family metallopeptidase [Flavobacteriaceae bacterium]